MGWASGSQLAESLWKAVRDFIPDEDREEVAGIFIDEFESMDCDTLDECYQLMEDAGKVYDVCDRCCEEYHPDEGTFCEECRHDVGPCCTADIGLCIDCEEQLEEEEFDDYI